MDSALEKDILDLEENLHKVKKFIKSGNRKSSLSTFIEAQINQASSALKKVCVQIEKNNEDVHIEEFSDHDEDWDVDDFDDNVDDMIKACENAENSFEAESLVKPDPLDIEKEDEKVLPSDEKIFDCEPPSKEHLDILKQFFGHASFRPMQWKIIRSILVDHADITAVMATGYGKSLCYQYPAVYMQKPVIVISPLISLMEDQVMALNVANISACYLGSSQSHAGKVTKEILQGEYKVIYVTPEYVENRESFFQSIDSKIGITLFAIDEAHCVSQWGHDFRSSYRKLGNLRSLFPKVPFLAVTATATPTVLKDICLSLHLKNPLTVVSSFDRPNLYLEVCMKSGSVENDLLRVMTKKNGNPCFSGPTIIYTPTRKSSEDVYTRLCDMGVSCKLYHAGMSFNERKDAHHQFVHDKAQVVVATVAFGMGIDKPDVRRVIHYGAPKDIESYYQEIGRAGRDGSQSICQVFYSNADFVTSKFFIKDIKSEKFQQHKIDMICKMQQYLGTTHCRRQMLLSHFQGEETVNCGGFEKCCDNCKKKIKRAQQNTSNGASQQNDDKRDFAEEAKLLFSAIEFTGSRYGLSTPILILRGSSNQKITDQMKKCPVYGKGKHKSENWWKAFGRILLCEKYLMENHNKPAFKSKSTFNSFATTVSLTPEAKTWFKKATMTPESSQPLILELSSELISLEETKVTITVVKEKSFVPSEAPMKKILCLPSESSAATADIEGLEEDILDDEAKKDPIEEELKGKLYKQLMHLRNIIADGEGIAPYMVLSNKNLLDIAVHRPSSQKSLSQIDGITAARISKFGQQIVDFVVSFCEENNLEKDNFSNASEPPKINVTLDPGFYNLKTSAQDTYKKYMLEEKKVDKIATERGLAASTICGHLIEALQAGLRVNLKDLGVTKDIFDTIVKVIQSPPINSDVSKLTPIKQLCPDYIEFNHIKVVISALKYKYGYNEVPVENKEEKSSSKTHVSPELPKKGVSFLETNASSPILKREFHDSSISEEMNSFPSKKLKTKKLFKI